MSTPTIALDLGCGASPRNPFNADMIFGVDAVSGTKDGPVIRADLVLEPIPFDDASLDYVTAYDFLEHVPRTLYIERQRRHPFVELINEIWRVLKPGGTFLSFTPAYPHAPAFRDPTHVNIITDETFPLYFDDTNRMAARYGYGFTGAFHIHRQTWQAPWLETVMIKVNAPG